MKLTIIAVSLLAAASAACAESSINLSGDFKLAGAYGNGGTTPIDGTAADHWRLNDLLSFVGVSGRQDLVNGLKGGFDLQSFVSVDTGNTWSDAGGSGPFFSRKAVITLDGTFGEVYAGRALTPSQLTGLLADPWYWDGSAAQVGWQVQQANYTSTQYLRTNNTIGFVSAKTAGFTLSLAASPGEKTTSKDLGGSLLYSDGPIWAGVAYDQSHGVGNDPTLNHTIIAVGAYDFGVVRPVLSYTSSKVLGVTYDAYSLGATAPAGPNGLVKFEYAHLSDFDTATAGKQAYRKFGIGYQYNLNKSANLFTNYSSAKGDGDTATNSVEAGVEYGF